MKLFLKIILGMAAAIIAGNVSGAIVTHKIPTTLWMPGAHTPIDSLATGLFWIAAAATFSILYHVIRKMGLRNRIVAGAVALTGTPFVVIGVVYCAAFLYFGK